MQQQLQALNKDCVVVDDFDKPFTLSTFQSNEHKIDLLNALCKLLNKNIILISTERLFFSLLPDVEKFKRSILNLKKGKDYDYISRKLHLDARTIRYHLDDEYRAQRKKNARTAGSKVCPLTYEESVSRLVERASYKKSLVASGKLAI